MTLKQMLRAIDQEISRLEQARHILTAQDAKSASAPSAKKKRVLSEDARRRIAEAQKKRWRKQKKAAAAN